MLDKIRGSLLSWLHKPNKLKPNTLYEIGNLRITITEAEEFLFSLKNSGSNLNIIALSPAQELTKMSKMLANPRNGPPQENQPSFIDLKDEKALKKKSSKELKKLLDYSEQIEDFEACNVIKTIMDDRGRKDNN